MQGQEDEAEAGYGHHVTMVIRRAMFKDHLKLIFIRGWLSSGVCSTGCCVCVQSVSDRAEVEGTEVPILNQQNLDGIDS